MHNHVVVHFLDVIFRALSDPTRRRIVDRLTNGPATVTELAEPFRLSQQAISKHVAALAKAQLISRRREGRQVWCALNPHVLREVAVWAGRYNRFWEMTEQTTPPAPRRRAAAKASRGKRS
jgi:DNA-binding transcriptional ArsR family regulator